MRLATEIFIGIVYCALLIASLVTGSSVLSTATLLLGAAVSVMILLAHRIKAKDRPRV